MDCGYSTQWMKLPTTTSLGRLNKLGRLKKLLNRPCKVVVNSYLDVYNLPIVPKMIQTRAF